MITEREKVFLAFAMSVLSLASGYFAGRHAAPKPKPPVSDCPSADQMHRALRYLDLSSRTSEVCLDLLNRTKHQLEK